MASDSGSLDAKMQEDDLDALIDAFEIMHKNDPNRKSFEENLAELENHPAFMKAFDPSKPLSAEMEGLMRLKYESEDPTAKAEAYKEDGNYEFKKKQYRVAIDNYTEGIKCKCPDRELNAVLYSNRAAAQFHLGNYRSSLTDCIFARKFKKDHFKALHRGALCCLETKKFNDCIVWCDAALLVQQNDPKILELRQKANKLQKEIERDKRKAELKERKEYEKELKLIQAISTRGVKLQGLKQNTVGKELDPTLLSNLEVNHSEGSKVRVDDSGVMYWPVLFMYPEHAETDYIQSFCETHRLMDHIENMFGPDVPPAPWDVDRKYRPDNINVYFEDKEKEELHKVNKSSTLLQVLQHENHRVMGGTPCFILTASKSPFEKSFLDRYKT